MELGREIVLRQSEPPLWFYRLTRLGARSPPNHVLLARAMGSDKSGTRKVA